MDNITALGMQARQQAMLDRLHNTAAVASSGGSARRRLLRQVPISQA